MFKWYLQNGQQTSPANSQEHDLFTGRTIVVDLAAIDGQTEDFEGREWLDGHVKDKVPLGWDLEWQPDRNKEADNPVALMQFADENTALLLRTHRTRNWLPSSVLRALQSDSCLKVIVGWDGPDKQKMANTFDLEPVGIADLAEIAKKKGIAEQGLKSLAEHFGFKMKKDSRMARSNWACPELTPDQVQYAADDAYFTYVLYDELMKLPDPELKDEEGYSGVDRGVLQMKPGWEEQGIARRHDGLWCSMCDQGPMTVPLVVERHIEGKKHQKKLANKKGLGTGSDGAVKELPDEYVMQGIVAGDGLNNIKVGEFKCSHCNAGPFSNLAIIDQHISSKKHQQKAGLQGPGAEAAKSAEPQKDPFEDYMWNMPDYVEPEEDKVNCTLCPSKASTPMQMFLHLGGTKHNKKCRSSSYPELIYIKERERLEVLDTGAPVVRKGFKAPKKAGKAASSKIKEDGASEAVSSKIGQNGTSQAEQAQAEQPRQDAAKRPLEQGWEEHLDPASGCPYYWNPTTQVSTWERPEAPEDPPPTPHRAGGLPPGWRTVTVQDQPGCVYYADVETQESRWDPPPPYVERDWKRHVDPSGEAFWRCADLGVDFYEGDPSWKRLMDQKQEIYWSNQDLDIRFFEPPQP